MHVQLALPSACYRSEDPLNNQPQNQLLHTKNRRMHCTCGCRLIRSTQKYVLCAWLSAISAWTTQCPENTLYRCDVTRSVPGNSHHEYGFMSSTAARRSSERGMGLAKDIHRLAPTEGLPRACIRQIFFGVVRTSQSRADQPPIDCTVWVNWFARS